MKRLATALLTLCLCLPALAAPVVLVDTLPLATASGTLIFAPPSATQGLAAPFSTSGSALTLTSVEARIAFAAGFGDSAGSNLGLGVFSDAAGNPGSLLVGLMADAPLPSIVNNSVIAPTSFSPVAPTVLAANTSFWVAALPSGTGVYGWSDTTSVVTGRVLSGSFWQPIALPLMRVTADDGLPVGVPEIQGAAASLPLLFCLGFLCVVCSRRPQASSSSR